jgi:hypothetical protein
MGRHLRSSPGLVDVAPMVDTVLIFLMGGMVGQIILVIGMNLWEWWESQGDPEPEPHPDEHQLYWHWNQKTQTYEMRQQ